MMRLNGWQRIGVVASIVWLLYGAYVGNEHGLHQGDWARDVYQACVDEPRANHEDCSQQFDRNWRSATQYHWEYAALYGLVPIPFGWLSVYSLLFLSRWIRSGFRPSP